jgi:hypothetical protein
MESKTIAFDASLVGDNYGKKQSKPRKIVRKEKGD